jgi:hypothetical protein
MRLAWYNFLLPATEATWSVASEKARVISNISNTISTDERKEILIQLLTQGEIGNKYILKIF